jgi:hypothetical protein
MKNFRFENFILSKNIPILEEKIEKLNKKAEKLGTKKIDLIVTNEVKHEQHGTKKIAFRKVVVVGQIPQIADWELVARFTRIDGKVFLTNVRGDKIPDHKLDDIVCEHCNINRFRKRSYLLENVKTNEQIEVGSSCLKDFLGHDPKLLLEMMKFNPSEWFHSVAEMREEIEYESFDLTDVLIKAKHYIEKYGFFSKQDERYENEISTASRVLIDEDDFDITTEDRIFISQVYNYFYQKEENDSYTYNVKQLMIEDCVSEKMMGLAVSMVWVYMGHLKKIEKEKQRQEMIDNSRHVGMVGEKIEIDVKIVDTKLIGTMYGTSRLYKFKDSNGNSISWFCSGRDLEAEVGDEIRIKGTVKKHDEYNGIKQTLLNRVKEVKK